ncbi:hypothetical protein BT67DRAFT_276051 [Trichocladium antarcticum]|uniref:Uncharacterized protein n=1 Tax=Trichocladium antarcticum TaxID=1450529 RepID=A0AAN6ZFD1_9PEZI|nr:hypothetical protein BT67DRAFT_276051 [Trichocladium antarcticum]
MMKLWWFHETKRRPWFRLRTRAVCLVARCQRSVDQHALLPPGMTRQCKLQQQPELLLVSTNYPNITYITLNPTRRLAATRKPDAQQQAHGKSPIHHAPPRSRRRRRRRQQQQQQQQQPPALLRRTQVHTCITPPPSPLPIRPRKSLKSSQAKPSRAQNPACPPHPSNSRPSSHGRSHSHCSLRSPPAPPAPRHPDKRKETKRARGRAVVWCGMVWYGMVCVCVCVCITIRQIFRTPRQQIREEKNKKEKEEKG